MSKDFYLHERALAGYVEKDWYDLIARGPARFATRYARFASAELYSDYHERLLKFLDEVSGDFAPANLLEVGSALGRTYFETCRRYPALRAATLVEPSENLVSLFKKIFAGEALARVPVLRGNSEIVEAALETTAIRASCASVTVELLQKPFQDVVLDARYDLVICSNVIDQCRDPRELADGA